MVTESTGTRKSYADIRSEAKGRFETEYYGKIRDSIADIVREDRTNSNMGGRYESELFDTVSDAMVRIANDDAVRYIGREPDKALNFASELLEMLSSSIIHELADDKEIDRLEDTIMGIFDAATKRSEIILGITTDILPRR